MKGHAVTNEINDLLRINQRILNYQESTGFRNHSVICKARTGQTIRFAKPENVQKNLVMLMTKFHNLHETSRDKSSLAFSLSLFWTGFIAVHPFNNGNGRTGKEYIREKLAAAGYSLKEPSGLDQILLTGDINSDLTNLHTFFMNNFIQKERI